MDAANLGRHLGLADEVLESFRLACSVFRSLAADPDRSLLVSPRVGLSGRAGRPVAARRLHRVSWVKAATLIQLQHGRTPRTGESRVLDHVSNGVRDSLRAQRRRTYPATA